MRWKIRRIVYFHKFSFKNHSFLRNVPCRTFNRGRRVALSPPPRGGSLCSYHTPYPGIVLTTLNPGMELTIHFAKLWHSLTVCPACSHFAQVFHSSLAFCLDIALTIEVWRYFSCSPLLPCVRTLDRHIANSVRYSVTAGSKGTT